jgi:hypothetical protein
METSGSKQGNKTLLWVAGGCLAVLVCVVAVFLFGFGGLYWLGSQVAKEVDISWEIPTRMNMDENFEFRIAVTNISDTAVNLIGVDFTANYLRGFLVEATDPPYSDTFQYPSLAGGEIFQAFTFNKRIAPGETLTIGFNGKAVIRGDFNGTVVVCINSSFNCRNSLVRTIIK